jgi:hypothetical protein
MTSRVVSMMKVGSRAASVSETRRFVQRVYDRGCVGDAGVV